MELKGFLSELLQSYRTFTEFKGDLVTYTFCHLFPNISVLLGICISVLSIFLFLLGNLSLFTTNSAECMETENKLEIEIALFIMLVTSKTCSAP